MSSLEAINNTLQEQTKVQEKTSTNIADLRDRIADMLSLEENRRGDELERRIEEKQQKQKTTGKPATSFRQGFAEGTGLTGLGKILQNMLGALGLGGGLLGGMTLGGLFGRAVGRLFFPAIGAFFGVEYLDKWIDPLVDKITGDDATWKMFGQDVDASKIISGFAGAMAVIFGKDAIVNVVKGLFGVGDSTKLGFYRKLFVRRLGLGAVIGFVGDALGDKIKELTGSEELGDAISRTSQWAAVGMIFGPKGALVLGIAALVYSGAKFVVDYFDKNREKLKDKLKAEINEDLASAAEEADAMRKSAKLQAAIAKAAALYSPMDESTRLDPAQRGMLEQQMEEVKALDTKEFRKLEALSAPFMVDRSLGANDEAIWDAAFSRALTVLATSRPDLVRSANEQQLKGFLANSPFMQGFVSADGFHEYLNDFVSGKAQKMVRDLIPDYGLSGRLDVKGNKIDASSGFAYMTQGQILESYAPQYASPANNNNIVDASQQTTIQNVQSQKVQLSDNFPAAVDNHYARQYMGIPGFGFTVGTTF